MVIKIEISLREEFGDISLEIAVTPNSTGYVQ
jgi:hypothetical protein